MFIRTDTELDTLPAEPEPLQVHVVRRHHLMRVERMAREQRQIREAAERVVGGVPIEHVEPPRIPHGHCSDLQRGAFDRERAWHGRIGDRVMAVLFLAVLLGLAAGWFN